MSLRKKLVRGFTIIELLVTMAIFSMLTAVVLANYFTFGANSQFVNAGEDVILALRQAQVYGAGTKKAATPCGTSDFECAYGVHFVMLKPDRFVTFVDYNNSGNYDVGEEIETIIWDGAVSITGIKCTIITSDCVGNIINGATMDVTFRRPSPDARIFDLVPQAAGFSGYKNGWITLSDANTGKTSTIAISLPGQISIQ